MSAKKKTTTKTNKSPAPATKETKAPAKTVVRKTATAKSAAVAKPERPVSPLAAVTPREEAAAAAGIVAAVVRAAAPLVATSAAPAAPAPVKEVAGTSVRTTITAKIDVGFGNALYLRGEGPGLSWDQGRVMTNVGADAWRVQLGEATRPYAFKFLINDVTWSAGADYTLAPGASGTFAPEF